MTSASVTLLLAFIHLVNSVNTSHDEDLLVPEFDYVPPSRSYYNDFQSGQPIRVSCRAWPPPPLSSISYYTASRASSGSNANQQPVPLYPLRESLVVNESAGHAIVTSGPGDLALLNSQSIHCIASTPFGSILSPPFSLLRAGMDGPTSSSHHSESLLTQSAGLVVYSLFPGNVAVIRCRPPRSRPPAQLEFWRDGLPLVQDPRKHLLTVSNTGDHIDLLVSNFEQSDEGVYQCVAINPVTKQKWTDPQSYKLKLRDAPLEHTTKLVYGFADQRELVVREGANLTLYCVFETWPSQPTTVERVSDSHPMGHSRHRFDAKFGTMHLTGVLPEDEGWYRCASGTASSTVFLRVKPKQHVSLSPTYVSVPLGTSVTLNCSSSGPAVPMWYFNGRIKLSQQSTGYNSQLFIRSVDMSTTGVYQCVVHGDSDDTWISAQSVISLDSRRPIRKADYNQLLYGTSSMQESQSTTISETLSSRLITLSCLPPEPHLSRLIRWLSELLPGQDDIPARLNLANRLGFVSVHWRKDGVQLQLPAHADELLQLNLSLTRSVDFGNYRCELSASRHFLFAHETRVQRATLGTLTGVDSVDRPESKSALIHPGASSLSSPFAQYLSSGVSSIQPGPGNVSYSTDLTDRDKRNVLPNRAPPHSFTAYRDGLQAYADQTVGLGMKSVSHSGSGIPDPIGPALRLQRPNASTFGDNLAALISWSAVKADSYRILYRKRLPMSSSWSKPVYAEEATVAECCGQVPECCQQTRHIYLTNRQRDGLEPGHLYEFRIQAFIGQSVAGKSPWSDVVSFEHISKVAPVITETERLADGGMLVRWTLATSAVGFPIDHFLLLYRPEARMANGKISYDGFKTAFVDNGEAREFKLQDLEPGKGYQIVVYGVHTPAGLDPHMSVFKGAIGGRRITQFSHEIFVKPKDALVDAGRLDGSLDAANSQVRDEATSNREPSFIFNSSESNRLMFLILGALAGFMLLIMICLVILCVWRQQRDKQRLLLYCHGAEVTGGKSTGSHMDQPSQTRQLPGSGSFMLNHLNTLEASKPTDGIDAHRSRQLSHRSSMIYPQPPPMSPPPPPPQLNKQPGFGRHTEDALEMASLMSDYAQQRHVLNPASLPPAQHYPAPPSMMLEQQQQQPYWAAVAAAQQQQQHLVMTGSKYSGQFVPVNYYPSNSTMAAAAAANLPYGMKREPPSGGSVHDGTDTECDALDPGIQFTGDEQQHLRPINPLSPGPHMNHTSLPYQSISAVSLQNTAYPSQQMTYDPTAPQQFHPHQFQPMDVESTRRHYHHQQQQAYPYPTHLGSHMLLADQRNPGCGTPTSTIVQPTAAPGLIPYSSFDPRMPAGSLPKSSLSLGHPPESDYLRQEQLCESIQSDNNRHHHHRRHRRRLTAESGQSDTPERDEYRQTDTGSADTGAAPLMTSSPVARVLPQMINHQGFQMLEGGGESETPPPLPQHHPSASYSPAMQAATRHPARSYPHEPNGQNQPNEQFVSDGPVDWSTAYNAPSWYDPRYAMKSGLPPQIPAHHRPYHIAGPLTYGQHNPGATATAPNSLTRRAPSAALLTSPPRVRDYSEYGIPNVHHHHHPSEVAAAQGSMESVNRGRAPVPYPTRSSNGPEMRFTPLGETTG